MKVREIILDFTSLLDIVMIILFFFILFSTIDVDNISEQAKEAEASYTEMKEECEKEQEEWRKQASEEWERILSADENAAKNQQALITYNEGSGLSFNLHEVQRSNIWTLSVVSGGKKIGEISSETKDLRGDIKSLIKKAGYDTEDVIIGTLTYDGYSFGTEEAVPTIVNAVSYVQREYKNLYFTTVNISK